MKTKNFTQYSLQNGFSTLTHREGEPRLDTNHFSIKLLMKTP
jgi:hypothetical protein